MKSACFAVILALALAGSGCGSDGRRARIQEKQTAFAALAPEQQSQIQNGGIEIGYTADMIYMSLGKPSKIVTSASGDETTWVYSNYYVPDATYLAIGRWARTGSGQLYNATSRETVNNARRNQASTSISSTASTGLEPSMEVPDLPSETLYITFRRGRVIDMRLGD